MSYYMREKRISRLVLHAVLIIFLSIGLAGSVYCEDCEERLQRLATKCQELIPLIQKSIDDGRKKQAQEKQNGDLNRAMLTNSGVSISETALEVVQEAADYFAGAWKTIYFQEVMRVLPPGTDLSTLDWDCSSVIEHRRDYVCFYGKHYSEWDGSLLCSRPDDEYYLGTSTLSSDQLVQMLSDSPEDLPEILSEDEATDEPTYCDKLFMTPSEIIQHSPAPVNIPQELQYPGIMPKAEIDAIDLLIGATRGNRTAVLWNNDGSISILFRPNIAGSVDDPKAKPLQMTLDKDQAARVVAVLEYTLNNLKSGSMEVRARRDAVYGYVNEDAVQGFRAMLESNKDFRDIAKSMAIDIPSLVMSITGVGGAVAGIAISAISTGTDTKTIVDFLIGRLSPLSRAEILEEAGGKDRIAAELRLSGPGNIVVRDWVGQCWENFASESDTPEEKMGFFANRSITPTGSHLADVMDAMGSSPMKEPGRIPDLTALQQMMSWMKQEDHLIAKSILANTQIIEQLLEAVYLDNTIAWIETEIEFVSRVLNDMR